MKVGLDEVKNKSQIKKYKVIGANFEKLMNYIDVLPNRWSTVYKLANLSEAKLDSLVKANVLHPNVTASEIDLYVKPQQVIVSVTRTILSESLRFRFNQDLTNEQVTELLVTIDDWKKRERSGSTNLNSEISGNSGDNALTAMVRQTGVFHGQAEEEGRRCQTCTQAAHRRIQSAGGTCRVARGQNNDAVVSGI